MIIINPYRFTSLGWENHVHVSSIGDSIIDTKGILIVAKNGTNAGAGSKTVNGVTFTNTGTIGSKMTASYSDSAIYQDGNIGTDFEAMMDSFVYCGADPPVTFPLTGLTVGKTYLLQILNSDNRNNASFKARTQTYNVAGYTSETIANYMGYSVKCRFVASATSHNVTITFSSAPNLCGYQVRQLD
jgi:hypothetical protein